MMDIETLGTRTDAVVLSVALTTFTQAEGVLDNFETVLDVDTQIKNFERTVDFDTVHFWMAQSENARKKAFSDIRDPLSRGISALVGFFHRHRVDSDPLPVWSMPPSFDATILGNLITKVGYDLPWHYRELRDLRTLVDATGDPDGIRMDAYGDPKMIGFVPHDPLWDCHYQIEVLRRARVRLAMNMAKGNLASH